MGFSLDVVSYSRRSTPANDRVRQRVREIVDNALVELGLTLAEPTSRAPATD